MYRRQYVGVLSVATKTHQEGKAVARQDHIGTGHLVTLYNVTKTNLGFSKIEKVIRMRILPIFAVMYLILAHIAHIARNAA